MSLKHTTIDLARFSGEIGYVFEKPQQPVKYGPKIFHKLDLYLAAKIRHYLG